MTLGQFVHVALYEPELGYYSSGARKFGEQGDFITAPELGSVFAQCVARGVRRVFDQLDSAGHNAACVVELGAGSGRFAYDCLMALHALGAEPSHYRILEVSADLRERQQTLLATLPDRVRTKVEWLDTPPQQDFDGVLIANEVIDALPMERFGLTNDGQLLMEFIDVDTQSNLGLRSVAKPATATVAAAVEALRAGLSDESPWSLPYIGELRVGLSDWLDSVTARLRHGAALFVDYGTDAAELYRSDRSAGTLLCHYRHRAHDQVLLWPGLQDITSWVDFTQVAHAAAELGWTLDGYTTQAHMLIDFGLDEVVAGRFAGADTTTRLSLASEVRQLTLPGEMGERFKAMSLSRGVSHGLLSPSHAGLERRL